MPDNLSASPNAVNVYVLDEHFPMPQLNRTRRIWVYLPPNYFSADKRYPVIYMHDGQNLFDEAMAYDKEWEVDETLNKLQAGCIVVGIDNSEHRMTEYNYHHSARHGTGEGQEYMDFIVNTLKPYIDASFNTKTDRQYTHIAGSSMGGLISLYGALHFTETFGSAGVFSPSLWAAPSFSTELAPLAAKHPHLPQRFFLYGGAKESRFMVKHLQNLAISLQKYPQYEVYLEIDPHGEHSEYYWRHHFPGYYRWLMQESEDK